MKKIISILIKHWIKSPIKITLTLLSVSLGTGILILSFSAGIIIENEITSLLNSNGTLLQVANGVWGDNGKIEQERPANWDRSIKEKLLSDTSTVSDVAIVTNFPVPNLNIEGKSYQVRNIIGSDESYLDIHSLDIIKGVPMTKNDFDNGLSKVWISEETAEILYGSAQNALGKKITPPGRRMHNRESNIHLTQFTVTGVYETPTEVTRRAYGIADILFPLTSFLPTSKKSINILDFLSGKLVIKSNSISIDKTTSEIQQVVEFNFGENIPVTVWEGNPNGESLYMSELRSTVSIINTSLRILGFVLLLTSSIGIFSIMVVEALGRRKEIGIERALGATKFQIVKEFWQWSTVLSSFGAILGIGLAILLSSLVLGTLNPIISEISSEININSSIKPAAILQGVILTLGCGGFLGLLPSFGALKGDISEILREV